MMINMRKSSTMLLLLLLTLLPAIVFADAESIFKENSKAVVVIGTFDSKGEAIAQGSGFIIRQDGVILTNYHVISNAVDIKVKLGDKVLDVEGLIYKDVDNDLVILKIKGEKLPVVKTGDFLKTNVGEKVYVISSPEGLENTISDGILSGIRDIDEKRKILQITAPVSEGSSGGPVFNKDGEVIGVATFIIKAAQNLNFAMPVNLIKDKVSNNKTIALKDADIVDYKKTAEYWFYLGVAYGDLGEYQEEVSAYKEAIKINPDSAEAYHNLGVCYRKLDKNQEAVDAYIQAIRINPDNADAYGGLGAAYIKLDNKQDAIVAYKQALRINPGDVDGYVGLGIAYELSGLHQEAVAVYKQAIRINPDDAKVYSFLGACYRKLNKNQEAVDTYIQAIKINPDDAFTHYNLGLSYSLLGRYQEAVDAFNQAIRINPDYAKHIYLGLAYVSLGRYQEAVDAYKQAIRINPDDTDIHYGLGLIYSVSGDKGSALEEYKILKDLDKEKADKLFNLIYK